MTMSGNGARMSPAGWGLLLGLCLLFGAVPLAGQGGSAPAEAPENEQPLSPSSWKLFRRVFSMVQHTYVDPKAPAEIIEGALESTASLAGPESAYIRPEDVRAYRTMKEGGTSARLPLYITKGHDFARVLTAFPERDMLVSPSDALRTIGGTPTYDLSYPQCLIALHGKPGQDVECMFLREEDWESYTVTLTRVPLPDAEFIVRPSGGVLVLPSLPASLPRAAASEIAEASGEILVDLTYCAQGDPEAAVRTVGLLLGKRTILVKGDHGEKELKADGQGLLAGRKIRLLVGETTARGGEVVASALASEGALCIGSATLGWAPYAEDLPLSNGGILHINTGFFLAPDGEVLSDHGVEPRIALERGEKEPREAFYDRALAAVPPPPEEPGDAGTSGKSESGSA